MKKFHLLICFFLLFSFNKISAQKFLTLDEMAKIASIQDPVAFGKFLIAKGYKKEEAPTGPGIKEMFVYRDPYTFPGGNYCSVSWIVLNDKTGQHKYTQFQFENKDLNNRIYITLLQRGYTVVSTEQADKKFKINSIIQSLRKGSVGIQFINTIDPKNPDGVPLTQILFSIITTPNWPNDEMF